MRHHLLALLFLPVLVACGTPTPAPEAVVTELEVDGYFLCDQGPVLLARPRPKDGVERLRDAARVALERMFGATVAGTGATNGQVLVYDSTDGRWEPATASTLEADTLATVTGRGATTSTQVALNGGATLTNTMTATVAALTSGLQLTSTLTGANRVVFCSTSNGIVLNDAGASDGTPNTMQLSSNGVAITGVNVDGYSWQASGEQTGVDYDSRIIASQLILGTSGQGSGGQVQVHNSTSFGSGAETLLLANSHNTGGGEIVAKRTTGGANDTHMRQYWTWDGSNNGILVTQLGGIGDGSTVATVTTLSQGGAEVNYALTLDADTGASNRVRLEADAGNLRVRNNADSADSGLAARTVESTVSTGTAPLTVASTTVVANLNADALDGQTGSYYLDRANHTGTLTWGWDDALGVDATSGANSPLVALGQALGMRGQASPTANSIDWGDVAFIYSAASTLSVTQGGAGTSANGVLGAHAYTLDNDAAGAVRLEADGAGLLAVRNMADSDYGSLVVDGSVSGVMLGAPSSTFGAIRGDNASVSFVRCNSASTYVQAIATSFRSDANDWCLEDSEGGLQLASDNMLTFSSTTAFSGGKDAGIARISSGILAATSGTTTTTRAVVQGRVLHESHVDDDAISTANTGSYHDNNGATQTVTLQLAVGPAEGTWYEFTQTAAQAFRIEPGTGQKFIGANLAVGSFADGDYVELNTAVTAGSWIKIVADANGDWIIYGFAGTLVAE